MPKLVVGAVVGIIVVIIFYYLMLILVGALLVRTQCLTSVMVEILMITVVAPVVGMREQGGIKVGCVHQLK